MQLPARKKSYCLLWKSGFPASRRLNTISPLPSSSNSRITSPHLKLHPKELGWFFKSSVKPQGMEPEVPRACWEHGKGAAPTSIWFCCGVFTSHSVGTWLRLSAGRKSLGSAMSERESAGDEKRELLLESSSRYEESWNRGTAMVGGGRMRPESSFLTQPASSDFLLLSEQLCSFVLHRSQKLIWN